MVVTMRYAVRAKGLNLQERCWRVHILESAHNIEILAQALGKAMGVLNPLLRKFDALAKNRTDTCTSRFCCYWSTIVVSSYGSHNSLTQDPDLRRQNKIHFAWFHCKNGTTFTLVFDHHRSRSMDSTALAWNLSGSLDLSLSMTLITPLVAVRRGNATLTLLR